MPSLSYASLGPARSSSPVHTHLQSTGQVARPLLQTRGRLPNFADVALFLRVHPSTGLFQFGPAYRPVPLTQTFVGISMKTAHGKKLQPRERKALELSVVYEKALAALRRGKQVMIFVHARNDTVRTARAMLDTAKREQQSEEWLPSVAKHPRCGALGALPPILHGL